MVDGNGILHPRGTVNSEYAIQYGLKKNYSKFVLGVWK